MDIRQRIKQFNLRRSLCIYQEMFFGPQRVKNRV